MKNRKTSFFAVFLFFPLFLLPVLSQFESTPVEKSGQKILHQGKTYYIHTVKAGHTLYSLCKAYGVTQEEIEKANPGIVLVPLSVGLTLKIPAVTPESLPTKPPVQPDVDDTNFIYHTVQPKETLYSLHQKYNVPIELIYMNNPGSETGLKTGQILKIPVKKVPGAKTGQPAITPGKLTQYTVKQGDTLYRIAQNFGVYVDDIVLINPELRWGLRTAQTIVIPLDTILQAAGIPLQDSLFIVGSFTQLNAYQCDSIASLKIMRPATKVALLLPFYAKESYTHDTLPYSDTIAVTNQAKLKTIKSRVSIEFYEGLLLALDSLKKMNHNVSLFVYDTEADTIKVKKILRDLDIIEPDLIIGPLTPENIKLVSNYSFEKRIPFIPPLTTSDSIAANNPYLFRVIPGTIAEHELYIRHLTTLSNENIIFVSKPDQKTINETERFKNLLFKQLAEHSGFDSANFHDIVIDDKLQSRLSKTLKPEQPNNVIIFSSYEPDVIQTMSHLHFMLREHNIKVYGFPAWQRFDNVRFDVLHELQLTLYSPFYIDYSDNHVKAFIRKCRERFQIEPFRTTSNGINYTYLGYDLTMYFIQAANRYGDNICDCIDYYKNSLLLSDYRFARNQNQYGFINYSISLITYNRNYSVTKIRTSEIDKIILPPHRTYIHD